MDLKPSGEEPHQEENMSCASVQLENVVEFFSTDNKQRYKCSTLPDAHHATQALLDKMFKDTTRDSTKSNSSHSLYSLEFSDDDDDDDEELPFSLGSDEEEDYNPPQKKQKLNT